MSSDMLFFIFRFIGFIVVSVIFFIAGRMVVNNIVYENYCKERYKLDRRRAIARLLFFCGVLIGILSILELCINNFNEWLGMKISGYIFLWSTLAYFAVTYGEGELIYKNLKKLRLLSRPIGILASVGGAAVVGFLICGCILSASQPAIYVEREILSSTNLAAVNEGRQFESKLANELFTGVFVISDEGVYRYYYRAEKDGIKQGYVDVGDATIYFIKEGELPHLDHITSYEYKTHSRNNKAYRAKNNEETWYELYVPKGSVVEAYEFNLN